MGGVSGIMIKSLVAKAESQESFPVRLGTSTIQQMKQFYTPVTSSLSFDPFKES